MKEFVRSVLMESVYKFGRTSENWRHWMDPEDFLERGVSIPSEILVIYVFSDSHREAGRYIPKYENDDLPAWEIYHYSLFDNGQLDSYTSQKEHAIKRDALSNVVKSAFDEHTIGSLQKYNHGHSHDNDRHFVFRYCLKCEYPSWWLYCDLKDIYWHFIEAETSAKCCYCGTINHFKYRIHVSQSI